MDRYTLERTVDRRLNIDDTPQNKDIDCGVKKDKKKKTSKFGDVADLSEESSVPPVDEYPAAEALTHLFTPATLYYYGQYFTDKQRENVVKRYDACPCPVPSVSHPCIYMDCMAFGMGLHCLQVTMQLKNINQARQVYDQLAILCPPFLALSSATPFQKGLLCDSDVRWLTIAASVDDRKREEVPRIIKSRYDSISVFISPEPKNLDEFNDSNIEIIQPYRDVLLNHGVDERLARHIAHLFIRDPLVMYDQMIDIDDQTHTTHFENIQSTNWQTVRFKPPPPGSSIGWRVEFRVMDIQPTPFENAALSVFIVLLTAAIAKYKPIFYTKMSTVDENMGRAHRINPCQERYVMRKNIFPDTYTSAESETEKMSVNDVFNGSESGYYGLIPLVRRYLKDEKTESESISAYLKFISMRAAGKIPTAAQYLRNFVLKHPDYKQDSRLSQKITHDIVMHVHDLASGKTTDDTYLPMKAFYSHKREREE
ncbi:glutamate--cysteine ligase catalytic subunit [Strigomonas culicis]|nr:glutamate--cysteine ligase catalytic subunit [Strigomonas culicis]|eukprot:EPY22163.1 glutamate--cysteine ligase catalytic subunit [Strigomonas culicis]